MKQFIIQVRDRVTGQGTHCSDPFDDFRSAVEYAKTEYGPPDFSNEAYWILETITTVKSSCPYYLNRTTCAGDVVFKDGNNFGTCAKCGRDIPVIVKM